MCPVAKPNCGSSILHTKDNGEELGSKNQNKLRKNNNLRMGRKKKEKEPSAAEGKGKEEADGNEAEVEPEKRAGRRSSKPVVAKWAIGDCTFFGIDNSFMFLKMLLHVSPYNNPLLSQLWMTPPALKRIQRWENSNFDQVINQIEYHHQSSSFRSVQSVRTRMTQRSRTTKRTG